jgi:hypothetical protein
MILRLCGARLSLLSGQNPVHCRMHYRHKTNEVLSRPSRIGEGTLTLSSLQ